MAETNEMLATLQDVVSNLNELKIDYMVTGSVATSKYATARTTIGIDASSSFVKPMLNGLNVSFVVITILTLYLLGALLRMRRCLTFLATSPG
jgi:hypothetical protein